MNKKNLYIVIIVSAALFMVIAALIYFLFFTNTEQEDITRSEGGISWKVKKKTADKTVNKPTMRYFSSEKVSEISQTRPSINIHSTLAPDTKVPEETVNTTPRNWNCKIYKAVDSRTLLMWVDGELMKVRLAGVSKLPIYRDGLEQKGMGWLNGIMGQQKQYLAVEVSDNQPYDDAINCFVWIDDGILANQEIIAKGYGLCELDPNHEYYQEMVMAEARAKMAEIGIWKYFNWETGKFD